MASIKTFVVNSSPKTNAPMNLWSFVCVVKATSAKAAINDVQLRHMDKFGGDGYYRKPQARPLVVGVVYSV